MVRITPDELARDFTAYFGRVEEGETVIVTRDGRAVAEIKPVAARLAFARPAGLYKGEFVVPDDFDAPLPRHVLDSFGE